MGLAEKKRTWKLTCVALATPVAVAPGLCDPSVTGLRNSVTGEVKTCVRAHGESLRTRWASLSFHSVAAFFSHWAAAQSGRPNVTTARTMIHTRFIFFIIGSSLSE